MNEKSIEDLVIYLTNLLYSFEEMEAITTNLTRDEYLRNKEFAIGVIREGLILIYKDLSIIKENYPEILESYHKVPWNKYINIGKAIHEGKFIFIYSLAWKMATEGVKKMKNTIMELLDLHKK